MGYDDVIALYGSQSRTAAALGCTQASVAEWKSRGVPPLRQFQIEVLTAGRLKAARLDKPPGGSMIEARSRTADRGATATAHVGEASPPTPSRGGRGGSGSGLHQRRGGVKAKSQDATETNPKDKTVVDVDAARVREAKPKPLAFEVDSITAPAKPQPQTPGGAAARMALLEAGPSAARDATRTDDAPGDLAPVASQPKIIAAPIAPRPQPTRKLASPWRASAQSILAKAKDLGVPVIKGDKWGDVIARIEDAISDKL